MMLMVTVIINYSQQGTVCQGIVFLVTFSSIIMMVVMTMIVRIRVISFVSVVMMMVVMMVIMKTVARLVYIGALLL